MRYSIFTPMEYVAGGDRAECIAETNNLDVVEMLWEHNEYVVYDAADDVWLGLLGAVEAPPSQMYYAALDFYSMPNEDFELDEILSDFESIEHISDEWLVIEDEEKENE